MTVLGGPWAEETDIAWWTEAEEAHGAAVEEEPDSAATENGRRRTMAPALDKSVFSSTHIQMTMGKFLLSIPYPKQ